MKYLFRNWNLFSVSNQLNHCSRNLLCQKVCSHILTSDPNECYKYEKKEGRYKNVYKVEAAMTSERKVNSIRFVCISDTHTHTENLAEKLPDGDILIHAGDFTRSSTKRDIIKFNNFLGTIKERYKHIVVIAGNHELTFDQRVCDRGLMRYKLYQMFIGDDFTSQQLNPYQSKKLLTNCKYIENESIELFGIKIYGAPWQPERFGLAFNKPRGEEILNEWNKIPNDTDILVTHGPPLGIGDKTTTNIHCGCAELATTVMDRVKPKYFIFGHIHEAYGIWRDDKTVYINAAICNRQYKPVHKPIVFDYLLDNG